MSEKKSGFEFGSTKIKSSFLCTRIKLKTQTEKKLFYVCFLPPSLVNSSSQPEAGFKDQLYGVFTIYISQMYFHKERFQKRVDGQEDQDTQRICNKDYVSYPTGYFSTYKEFKWGLEVSRNNQEVLPTILIQSILLFTD